jgi:hypothetical protein
MEVCKDEDIAGGGLRLVHITRDNPLWLRGVCYQTEKPILDEPRRDLVGEAGASSRIHREEQESTLATTVAAAAAG